MNDTAEHWLPIPGYEGRYDVSSLGRVRSHIRRPQVLRQNQRSAAAPYLAVSLSGYDHVKKTTAVHSAVCAAFIGPCPDGLVVRHLNGDACDNRAVNLKYGTPEQNTADSIRHGTNYAVHEEARRTNCPQGHPYDEANTYIAEQGGGKTGPHRICRQCGRDRDRAWIASHQEEYRARCRINSAAYKARKKAKRMEHR